MSHDDPITLATEPRRDAAPEIVADDRPCAGCGYSLRGLRPDGECPECAMPVRLSLRGTLLRYGSPIYLARLHRGAFLVELAIALSVVGAAALIVLQVWFGSTGAPGGARGGAPGLAPSAIELLGTGWWLGVSVLGLLGWWLISTPDPGLTDDAPGMRARRVLRIGLVVQAMAALLSLVFDSTMTMITSSASGAAAVGLVSTGLSWVDGVAWLVSFFAAMAYVRRLASRIPSQAIEARAARLSKLAAYTIAVCSPVLVILLLLAVAPAPLAMLAPVVGFSMCVGLPLLGVVLLVGFIMYIVLIDGLRSDLLRERLVAESERAMNEAIRAERGDVGASA